MASPQFNPRSPTIKRILREAAELSTTPSPDYHASPVNDSNLFEWHFTLRGPPSSPFASGIYHGRIILPPTYPLRPPSFRFLTASGRFETNREICLSISGHHEETWQPAWGIRTALVALRSFMETDAKGQLGGLDTSEFERRHYADQSAWWKCATCGKNNGEILAECIDAAKALEEEGGKKLEEEKVPDELVIGSREDLGLSASGAAGKEKEGEETEETEAKLAEGFVQTQPLPVPDSTYPAAQPGQTVPRPTGTSQSPQQAQLLQTPAPLALRRTQIQAHVSSEGVPLWIDRAIAGIVVCLVVMILKILLGL